MYTKNQCLPSLLRYAFEAMTWPLEKEPTKLEACLLSKHGKLPSAGSSTQDMGSMSSWVGIAILVLLVGPNPNQI